MQVLRAFNYSFTATLVQTGAEYHSGNSWASQIL